MVRNHRPSAPASTEALVKVLEEECELFRRNRAMAKSGAVALGLTLTGIVLFLWITKGAYPSDMASNLSPFLLVMLGGAILSTRHRRALTWASQNNDPVLTGYLVEALHYHERGVASLAEEALSVRGMASLNQDQVRILSKALGRSNNPLFVGWAVSVLKSQGGWEAIQPLEGLALKSAEERDGRWQRLESESRMALGEIRLRLARNLVAESSTTVRNRT